MLKACSADFRERVIEAVEEGASRREAAERFAVSPSSAVKWLQSWQNEGRRSAKPRGGSFSRLEDYAEQIRHLVKERPDRDPGRASCGKAQAENTGKPPRGLAVSRSPRHHI
jgi:transposase